MVAEVNLDADVYAFADNYARAKDIPLGTAISELLRQVDDFAEPQPAVLMTTERGLLVKAKSGRTVTSEMVKKYTDEDFG